MDCINFRTIILRCYGVLTRKAPVRTAADDTFNYLFIYFFDFFFFDLFIENK